MRTGHKILKAFRYVIGTQNVLDQLGEFRYDIDKLQNEKSYSHDVLALLHQWGFFPFQGQKFRVTTDFPVAFKSTDHLYPRGTINDDTRCSSFVVACERLFPGRTLDYIDVGCSGGGLILDFLLRGHRAVGIEGSDVSVRAGRAEWKLFSSTHLFTADATKPFQIDICVDTLKNLDVFEPFSADIISAWEFMEHIQEEDLPAVFQNVKNHLKSGGYFIGSIPLFDDVVNGVSYHPTIKPYEWWRKKFAAFGFEFQERHPFGPHDFARGSGNRSMTYGMDYDVQAYPELGFHFVAKLIK